MRIKITVPGEGPSADRSSFSLSLPAVIGRSETDNKLYAQGSDGTRHLFPVGDQRASREHLKIEEVDGAARLVDRSRNGTFNVSAGGGRLPSDRGTALPADGATLRIGTVEFLVEPVGHDGSELVLQVVSPSGTKRDFDLGRGALIAGTSNNRLFLKPDQIGLETEDGLTGAEPDWCFAVTGSGANGGLRVRSDMSMPVRLNRASVQPGIAELRHLDVIEVGGHRMTVLQHGGPEGRVCANPECRLLNSTDHDENCRFCGTKLDSAETFFLRG